MAITLLAIPLNALISAGDTDSEKASAAPLVTVIVNVLVIGVVLARKALVGPAAATTCTT